MSVSSNLALAESRARISTSSGLDLDAILAELGSFGRFQLRNYCLIILPTIFSSIYNAQYVFAAGLPNYRCQVPECEASPPKWDTENWGQFALPPGDESRCKRRVATASVCKAASFLEITQSCDAWVYEKHDTIVADFDLACQEWKRTMVGSIHSAGLFAALIFIGFISDTIGRRYTFIATATLPALAGLIRSFSVNYYMYISLEFIEAFFASGAYTSGYILALEMVGLNQRVLAGSGLSMVFAVGEMLLAVIAWAFPHWRTLTRVIYIPSFCFIIYYFFLDESVRWLISKGRKKEAVTIILKAAAINRKQLSPETLKWLNDLVSDKELKDVSKPQDRRGQSLWSQVLHSKVLIARLAICSFWWITITFIYYGLSINSVTLAGNQYINYGLTALVEIPGYVISLLTLDRFGRKTCIMTSYFMCGISLISIPFVPAALAWLQLTLSLVGKLAASAAISGIYIYALEMFPTEVRHFLLGFCCLAGRTGLILAPYTPILKQLNDFLAYVVFGVMAGIAGLLMILTPETLKQKLPETVSQAERLSTKNPTPSTQKPKS